MAPVASGRRSPLAAAGQALTAGHAALASEGAALADAGKELEALRSETSVLEARLRDVLRPQLTESAKAAAVLRARSGELSRCLEALSKGREEAAERVGSLSKRQLSEIKQLTRSPPEAVRRTLSASWLILNSDRFRGQSTVHFDDTKDWPRCQRMLADEGFVSRIRAFDPASLDQVPSVPAHIASVYLGMLPGEAGEVGGSMGSRRSERAERSTTPAQRSTRPSLARSSTRLPPIVKQPLEFEAVERASQPCAALLRWLTELVAEHVERQKLTKELAEVEAELVGAEQSEVRLEGDVAEAESALSRARTALAEREQALERLRQEQSAAQRAARDVARLDALGSGKESPAAAPPPAQRPKPKPKPPSPAKVELEVSGTLAVVEQQLARLGIKFDRGESAVLEGDPTHALTLPKIADILKEHRGKMKLLIEGHRGPDEEEGLDLERSLAVYQWLVEVAGCTPGFLRIKGRGTGYGMGQCVVPVPTQELVARQGPLAPEAEAAQARPGIYFENAAAELGPPARAILAEMAKCILSDDYTVRIEGHADKGEQPEVALKRARVVRDALLDLGVSKSQLKTESCKAFHPLSRLQTAVNRRVELHLE